MRGLHPSGPPSPERTRQRRKERTQTAGNEKDQQNSEYYVTIHNNYPPTNSCAFAPLSLVQASYPHPDSLATYGTSKSLPPAAANAAAALPLR